MNLFLLDSLLGNALYGIALLITFFVFGFLAFILKMYKKASPGEAMVRTGMGDIKTSFSGIFVFPVIHQMERMDITLKKVIISRQGKDGLICKDNLRADIQVNFFIRINKNPSDVENVAKAIGCKRASDPKALVELFDAKFSEALKTVGRQFDYVELYNSRDEFNARIKKEIGTELNGYNLDDCAIDYLEQTPITSLDELNILDAEGIKKITELTSQEKIKSNLIQRTQEKVIKQQNVEARETILELDRQLAEKEEKQYREISAIKAIEEAEKIRVEQEERLKGERARINTQEAIGIAEENKSREILIAQKGKEKALAVETERVKREQELEQTERERIVELAQIEKEKALEGERKLIQDVIRERIVVEKAVVEEEEKIKDTRAFAEADRKKSVTLKEAEMQAEKALIQQTKQAEASKQSAEFKAKQVLIEAEAEQISSIKKADAIKILAEAEASKQAAVGLAEAKVMEAKAEAREKEGEADAKILELEAFAQAKGIRERGTSQAEADLQIGQAAASIIEAKAAANEKQGLMEALVSREKYASEAKGIEDKANAMQKLDGVGREHEEFKLRLQKETEIELAQISVQKEIAQAQASVLAEAMKSANIDIVGGEAMIFDKLMGSIAQGKSIDRLVDNSKAITQIKDTFFNNPNGKPFKENFADFIGQFNLDTESIKNLSVANLLNKLASESGNNSEQTKMITDFGALANTLGIADKVIGSLGIL